MSTVDIATGNGHAIDINDSKGINQQERVHGMEGLVHVQADPKGWTIWRVLLLALCSDRGV